MFNLHKNHKNLVVISFVVFVLLSLFVSVMPAYQMQEVAPLPGQPQPSDHGFDHWFSIQNNALPNHHNPYNFVRDGIPAGPLQGYSADLVANEGALYPGGGH